MIQLYLLFAVFLMAGLILILGHLIAFAIYGLAYIICKIMDLLKSKKGLDK